MYSIMPIEKSKWTYILGQQKKMKSWAKKTGKREQLNEGKITELFNFNPATAKAPTVQTWLVY